MTDETLDELRPRLLNAILPHVAFDGWSLAAVHAGAADAGIDADVAALAYPTPTAMVCAFTATADAQMTQALIAAGIDKLRVRERITLAVRTRLEQAEPHREAIRRALAVFALPQNIALSAKTLWHTADAMWRAAGDTATDYNHYTKRLILGGVYSACLLYWLEDDSEARTDSWEFLDRRIAGIMQFEKVKAQVTKRTANGPSLTRFLGRLRYPAV